MRWGFTDSYDGNRLFKGFNLERLGMDQFFLNITSEKIPDDKIFLYSLNKECVKCPYLFRDKSEMNIFKTNTKFRIATVQSEYLPENETDAVICDLDENFGQFGIYETIVHHEKSCTVSTLKEPVNIYSPMLSVFLIYLVFFGILYACRIIYKTRPCAHDEEDEDENKQEETEEPPKKERVMSLDTFRGISIVIMIFVNFGGGGYRILEHTVWNGLHLADLVFPWFLWIMGACIPISLASNFKRNTPNNEFLLNVTKRSVKLFLLGIFLSSGSGLNYLRIFGVLQRFGISYFVVTITCWYLMKRETHSESVFHFLEDVLKLIYCWAVAFAILLMHTILFFTVAKLNCPSGYTGPGGLHENREHVNCIGGATGYIDEIILGKHRYQNPTIYEVYEAKPFDPEGILGCFTTTFQVFLGVQAGTTLLTFKKHSDRIWRWMSWAAVTGIIGGGLSGYSQESGIIPINKNLWSLSFVLVTTSFAFVLLTFCYVVIDMKKWWTGKPFLFAGMNAILLYIGHEMTDGHFPVRWYYGDDQDGDWRTTHFVALISDAWGAIFWVWVSYYLYKIKYFFTI